MEAILSFVGLIGFVWILSKFSEELESKRKSKKYALEAYSNSPAWLEKKAQYKRDYENLLHEANGLEKVISGEDFIKSLKEASTPTAFINSMVTEYKKQDFVKDAEKKLKDINRRIPIMKDISK